MSVSEIALAHQAKVIRRSEAAVQASLRVWQKADVADLDSSWNALSGQIVATASAAQFRNAVDSVSVTAKLGAEYGEPAAIALMASSFTGIDGSGRSLEGLLHGTVTTTKQAIGAGRGTQQAFLSGASYLASMMKTALADVARASDLTASAGKGWIRYVRVVNPGACSRCAILAGASSFSTAFQRHPACRCTAAGIAMDGSKQNDLPSSPAEYFDGLTAAEQDRIFTKSGAEAIRLGANPITVANARRGALVPVSSSSALTPAALQRSVLRQQVIGYSGSTPILGRVTLEATTKRGVFGRQVANAQRQRLMPETIMQLTPDAEMRKVLLRDAGFLDVPIPKSSLGNNSWITERAQIRAADRLAADEFFTAQGIRLG
jgi:hypothetical protein